MKEKNLFVQVVRFNKETRNFDEVVIHVKDCIPKDRLSARCPECGQRVRLMLAGDRHYEHDLRAGKPCKFKTPVDD